ncbi:MAG TPA: protein translocase subunit SecD [Rhizomicrobium sp.]|jgi:SecD/SecF fusion protein|nr:protein translocase subunit SecD [Rhizomicrobium sp.]HEX4534783.1 protein translocase subunit SecD [Rhizomicrobium sp.]
MLQIPTWSKITTALVVFFGILIALPNALPSSILAKMPAWLPTSQVSLGLDLQGGSYLLLEVELDQVQKDRLESLVGDVRVGLRKAHIGYADLQAKDDTVSVRIIDNARFSDARDILTKLNPVSNGSVFGGGAHDYDMTEPGNGQIVMKMTDAYKASTEADILGQSIEVVRKRIDEMGTKEPTIERQGDDRILVQVPGLQDPERLKAILGKTAKMTFQLVDTTADPQAAVKGIVPIGSQLLYMDSPIKGQPPVPVVVEKRVVVAGDRLADAQSGFDSRNGKPIINFRFDTVGAREFGNVTKENVGRPFAIVLDNKVITDPTIDEPILTGSGMISGSFTVQQTADISLVLRAGALPAPLKIIEERTVGAELGADSIKAGQYSAIAGLVLVALFMILRYGLFGVFADVALTLNVVLLLAALTLFGATLTLPGIAGIVLTMGMAVDANVLIYERMREEIRNGRTIIASIDTGFRRAMATIIDANATHLIASLILFQLGTGPVRGFAVTLGLGIITSFFTAVMVTRLIVITWFRTVRPRALAI